MKIAVHAPGHSPDMTCYLEAERGWLFTGDLYITSKPCFFRADENSARIVGSSPRGNTRFERNSIT